MIRAEREKKRKQRVKYIQILQESAAKRKLKEQENLRFFQSQYVNHNYFKNIWNGNAWKAINISFIVFRALFCYNEHVKCFLGMSKYKN